MQRKDRLNDKLPQDTLSMSNACQMSLDLLCPHLRTLLA